MCCSYMVLTNPHVKPWIQFIIMKIVMKIVQICPKSPRFTVLALLNFVWFCARSSQIDLICIWCYRYAIKESEVRRHLGSIGLSVKDVAHVPVAQQARTRQWLWPIEIISMASALYALVRLGLAQNMHPIDPQAAARFCFFDGAMTSMHKVYST